MTSTALAPVQQNERIKLIDAIRGIALLGILMMNIPYFSNSQYVAFNLNILNERSGANYYTWWAVNGIFEGTMRGLFSMLFGAGSILLISRLEKRKMDDTPADVYYRRLLWLFLFGLFNAFILQWPGDILYGYSICGLFLFPFRKMKPRGLLIMAAIFILCGTAQISYRYNASRNIRVNGEKALVLEKQKVKLTEQQTDDKQAWIGYQEKHKVENIKKAVNKEVQQIGGQGYFGVMQYFLPINAEFEGAGLYFVSFFDIMALFFIGLAFYKSGIITGKRSTKFYLALMTVSYIIGFYLSYYSLHSVLTLNFDATRLSDHEPVNFYEIRRALVSVGHLCLIILLYKTGIFKTLFQWLSRVGQMAFSNYLMQSIICSLLFYGYGLALFGKLQRYQEYYVVGCVWIFQIIFSNIWLHYYRFGPFEWVWRSLTYWKKQPMRRKSEVPETEQSSEELGMPALA